MGYFTVVKGKQYSAHASSLEAEPTYSSFETRELVRDGSETHVTSPQVQHCFKGHDIQSLEPYFQVTQSIVMCAEHFSDVPTFDQLRNKYLVNQFPNGPRPYQGVSFAHEAPALDAEV